MPHLLCRVVWANEYKSKKEDFFPGNMKYPAKYHAAHELLNFADENGYAYGFVENSNSWINLDNLGAPSAAKTIGGITVIWCALDKSTRRLRVVGWYDEATAYREPQQFHRSSARGSWAYQFKTKIQDAHLIPPAERFLEVPMRTRRTDKGFIGQRNWHFPDQAPQYARFLEAFRSIRLGRIDATSEKPIDRASFEEGQRTIAEINLVIRNPKLVAAAKARYGYRCQVCNLSFEERYGDLGKEFIEVHHLLPVSDRRGSRRSTTDDVRVVCANCHRMIHRGPKLMSVSELKSRLQ